MWRNYVINFYRKGTNLNPFMHFMKMYGSSKAVEGTTFLSILSGDGSGREWVLFFYSKDVIIWRTNT